MYLVRRAPNLQRFKSVTIGSKTCLGLLFGNQGGPIHQQDTTSSVKSLGLRQLAQRAPTMVEKLTAPYPSRALLCCLLFVESAIPRTEKWKIWIAVVSRVEA